MVHRRAVPSRAEVQALRAGAAVRGLRARRDGGRAAGLTDAPILSPLAAALSLTARRYAFERQRPVAGSAFASFFRRDVAAVARALTDRRPERLLVRASTGAPGWASIPWLACFAPHVTRSMRHGLYVVIFIDPVGERIVLSLQHGAADALTRHGATEGRRILREAAATTHAALAGRGHGFSDAPITLNSTAALPLGYEAGCALSRVWQADALDPAGLEDALSRMLDLYRDLVGGG
ncbi:DUF3578 domain-containing protein [Paracoccus gahaiensis]|uniref:DUF3578 domain-containing protein n=1 Tax=Paracoccus gahaiensis TaxID=1706839 RepID=A0A4U0R626_9RHOB|nr:DUF3578 domain-containing protein [Paracoccus gahaiensis]TJZ90441.1 DUF3578 domain-containing protein [Paracoccus gahaiensis]